jgi:hypothetical protein
MNISVDDLMKLVGKDQPVNISPPPSSADKEYIEKYKALSPEHKAAVNNQIDFFTLEEEKNDWGKNADA